MRIRKRFMQRKPLLLRKLWHSYKCVVVKHGRAMYLTGTEATLAQALAANLKIMNMRYSGYKRALEEGGLVFDEHLYGTAEFSSLDVQISTMLDRIFSEVPDVDGFFFATHVMAMDTFTYMSERHIDIRKFGYACIHEVNAFRLIVPNIKFAKMPVEEIGKNAVRIIYNNIMAKRKKVMLPVESLVIKCEMCNNKK